MNADARNLQISLVGCLLVQCSRDGDRYSEFMFVQARGDIRMRLGGNIGIYAERQRCRLAKAIRGISQRRELRLTLHVEQKNSCLDRSGDLGGSLANS